MPTEDDLLASLERLDGESYEAYCRRCMERSAKKTMETLEALMDSDSESVRIQAVKLYTQLGGSMPERVEDVREPPRTQFASFLAGRDAGDGGEGDDE